MNYFFYKIWYNLQNIYFFSWLTVVLMATLASVKYLNQAQDYKQNGGVPYLTCIIYGLSTKVKKQSTYCSIGWAGAIC